MDITGSDGVTKKQKITTKFFPKAKTPSRIQKIEKISLEEAKALCQKACWLTIEENQIIFSEH